MYRAYYVADTVPFKVQNATDIEKLISCESQGQNVSRPDDDGIVSDGILQFHRGPANTLKDGTWESFSKSSGITGSPLYPADAIAQADWAISHGLGPHWSCWRLQKLQTNQTRHLSLTGTSLPQPLR